MQGGERLSLERIQALLKASQEVCFTGQSRAQVTRLIGKYAATGEVRPPVYRRRRFPTGYTRIDTAGLASVDEAHDTMSGPATRKMPEREFGEYFLGIAQGQVRNPLAVARLPQFQVAGYSLLVLAFLIAFGFQRSAEFLPLPKWRGKSIRPWVLDIFNLTRQQLFSRQLQPMPGHENGFGHFAAIHLIGAKSPKLAFVPETFATFAA